jgi:predicted ribosomally synthesized peptide with nif11-like leader
MENKRSAELSEKAKAAKSPEELIALAKENGIELSAEQADAYFARLNPKDGELGDDELDDVAGGRKCGTTYHNDRPVVTHCNSCEYYQNNYDGKTDTGNGLCSDCLYFHTNEWIYICENPKRRNN